MPDPPRREGEPDLDLLEYVLVSAHDVDALAPVARAVEQLVHTGSIRLLDAVVLVRVDGSARVDAGSPADHQPLSGLTAVADGGVLLSTHDVELASVTLASDEIALLVLVEDTWAGALSDAARAGGARLTAGERIARDRVLASLGRAGATDLIVRSPGSTPLIDQVAQVRQLARLVERGLLSLDRYEVQRRRVLDG
ncbi:hypothetical protein [Nocardioides sp. YIM 152315]|uniref:hypothetical protein n=1 Tax=Nocardioides sp. YIM 152315 TaxID=3031760 RepID=UPI0023D993B7|nr:hypothetical protein [Nocardioides sp. YIM 152315]MDF1602099.1 hypothetical protein [Nocardioides sp. YIM 152315]